MNPRHRCRTCKQFGPSDPGGFGPCKIFGLFRVYGGNCEPCWQPKEEAGQE